MPSAQNTLQPEAPSKSTPTANLAHSTNLLAPGHHDLPLVDRTRQLNYNIPDTVIPTSKEIIETQQALGLSYATFGDVIIQDGNMVAQLRTKYFNKRDETPIKDLKGEISKTRLFGQTHWMHTCNEVIIPNSSILSQYIPRALLNWLKPTLISGGNTRSWFVKQNKIAVFHERS